MKNELRFSVPISDELAARLESDPALLEELNRRFWKEFWLRCAEQVDRDIAGGVN